jgi:hypothetical protein
VLVDDLDVVCVGVEHEGAVVPGVLDGALAGRAVVAVSGRKRGAVKGPHDAVVVGGKGEVDVLGHMLAGD